MQDWRPAASSCRCGCGFPTVCASGPAEVHNSVAASVAASIGTLRWRKRNNQWEKQMIKRWEKNEKKRIISNQNKKDWNWETHLSHTSAHSNLIWKHIISVFFILLSSPVAFCSWKDNSFACHEMTDYWTSWSWSQSLQLTWQSQASSVEMQTCNTDHVSISSYYVSWKVQLTWIHWNHCIITMRSCLEVARNNKMSSWARSHWIRK